MHKGEREGGSHSLLLHGFNHYSRFHATLLLLGITIVEMVRGFCNSYRGGNLGRGRTGGDTRAYIGDNGQECDWG